MADENDMGPWFVRVAHNKVSVGVFTCTEHDLPNLVDEACEPDGCEYKRLPPGGLIFGGEVVLHEWDPETDADHMCNCSMTDDWCAAYEDEGDWERVGAIS